MQQTDPIKDGFISKWKKNFKFDKSKGTRNAITLTIKTIFIYFQHRFQGTVLRLTLS